MSDRNVEHEPMIDDVGAGGFPGDTSRTGGLRPPSAAGAGGDVDRGGADRTGTIHGGIPGGGSGAGGGPGTISRHARKFGDARNPENDDADA